MCVSDWYFKENQIQLPISDNTIWYYWRDIRSCMNMERIEGASLINYNDLQWRGSLYHYGDVIVSAMVSQITSLTFVYSTAELRHRSNKYQSSASLAFVWEFSGTGEFPAQRASNVEKVSIWWRHHVSCGKNNTIRKILLLFAAYYTQYRYPYTTVVNTWYCWTCYHAIGVGEGVGVRGST